MTNPACPLCHQNQYVIKAGKNRTGTQRYRCQQCQGYFTPQPKPLGYEAQLREQAVRLYLEGMSYRGIAKVLRVHNQSIINWVNAAANALPEIVTDQTPTDYIEIDELFTFDKAKKTRFMS